MQKAYTFDDICLVPQYSNVPSRSIPSLESKLTKKIKIDIPVVASNMDTVIGSELAEILLNKGSIPIFHRFASEERQRRWVRLCNRKCFLSCGFQDYEQTFRIVSDEKPLGVCIDVAHGHCEQMNKLIRDWKKRFTDIQIIAGNICTDMGYRDLVDAGADAVKCGVGPGSCCTTRMVTGFGIPQFTAVQECAKIAQKLRVPLIADGGINNCRDAALALAAGASTVMIGKLFAKTYSSAAPKFEIIQNEYCKIKDTLNQENWFVQYRGQASKCFQEDFYGQVKKGTCPEGVDFYTHCSGSTEEFLEQFCGGLRSALTYGGSKDIKEFQRKAEFRVVNPTYHNESNYRDE